MADGDAEGSEVERMNEALRRWYAAFSESARQFGLSHGMHDRDAAALMHITTAEDRGSPLTPSRLARRIGLSPPATSSLLNRLEEAGHVERRRSAEDRRTVSLRSTPAVHDQIRTFFRDVGEQLDEVALRYPPDVLTAIASLIGDLADVLQSHAESRAALRP